MIKVMFDAYILNYVTATNKTVKTKGNYCLHPPRVKVKADSNYDIKKGIILY